MVDDANESLSRLVEVAEPAWSSGVLKAFRTTVPNEFSVYVRRRNGFVWFCRLIVRSDDPSLLM